MRAVAVMLFAVVAAVAAFSFFECMHVWLM
jgi:hypothetical protein